MIESLGARPQKVYMITDGKVRDIREVQEVKDSTSYLVVYTEGEAHAPVFHPGKTLQAVLGAQHKMPPYAVNLYIYT